MPNLLAAYRHLLQLFPAAYRRQYGDQMTQTLADMLADQPDRFARAAVWLRASAELPPAVVKQHLITGGTSMKETPTYIKRNGLIGLILLVPFFVVIVTGLSHNQRLAFNDWWTALVGLCLIVMPAIALILNVLSYFNWFSAKAQARRSIVSRLTDLRHSWPMVAIAGVAAMLLLVVLFHDSAHCLAGNPVREVHNPAQTWQCVDDGFLGGA